jgi:hypothetical protein
MPRRRPEVKIERAREGRPPRTTGKGRRGSHQRAVSPAEAALARLTIREKRA